jgi:uncharacterized membrane protein
MDWFLLALVSAILSAASAIFEKKVLFNLDALPFSFLAAILSAVFATPFFLFIDFNTITLFSLIILYIKSILGTVAFLCVMITLKKIEISRALPLMVLTPGLVAFFAFIFLGESLTVTEIIGMLLLLAGTYILETKAGQTLFDPVKVFINSPGHRYIFYALILFTATSILDKLLVGKYKLETETFIGFQHLFLALNFSLIYLFSKTGSKINSTGRDKKIWLLIILIAGLTVIYRYTQIEAIKIAPVALVLAIKRMSVFFAAVIGGKIFKEKNLLLKTIAAALMAAGAIMIIED